MKFDTRQRSRYVSKACEIMLREYLPKETNQQSNMEFGLCLDIHYFVQYEDVLKLLQDPQFESDKLFISIIFFHRQDQSRQDIQQWLIEFNLNHLQNSALRALSSVIALKSQKKDRFLIDFEIDIIKYNCMLNISPIYSNQSFKLYLSENLSIYLKENDLKEIESQHKSNKIDDDYISQLTLKETRKKYQFQVRSHILQKQLNDSDFEILGDTRSYLQTFRKLKKEFKRKSIKELINDIEDFLLTF